MELDIAVEAVLTANAAVHAVLRRLVGRCDALVGHSTGEHSAAMAAGALDLETDDRLAAFCHGLYASYADAAGRHEVPAAVLLALGADAEAALRIAREAGGELFLAMDNCPHQAVLVGEAGAAARARELALAEGLMCEQLPYDRAVHTPLFAPFAEDLRATFAGLPVRAPELPMWSCTTAAPCPQSPDEMRELLVEHWTRPVRFRETIEALYEDGVRDLRRGRSPRQHDLLHRGHPARLGCLRGGRRHPPAVGHRTAQPPRRPARRPRRRARPRAPLLPAPAARSSVASGDAAGGGGPSGCRSARRPLGGAAVDSLADAAPLGGGARAHA